MKLVLSSYGFNSPIIAEKYTQIIPPSAELEDKVCFVIPHAGYDLNKTFEREKNGLVKFGFNPENIYLIRSRRDMTSCMPDYIYVPGGDPFKLLSSIKYMGIMSDISDYVKNKGTTYIGVSAGASIVTSNIEYVRQLEDNNVISDGDFEALALIKECILCHYDHYSFATFKKCQEVNGNPVVTINDNQLLLFNEEKWKYIGETE